MPVRLRWRRGSPDNSLSLDACPPQVEERVRVRVEYTEIVIVLSAF